MGREKRNHGVDAEVAGQESIIATYEASLLLGVGTDCVRAMARRGDLAVAHLQRGGQLYRRADVLALVEARRLKALAAEQRRAATLAALHASRRRRAVIDVRAARKAAAALAAGVDKAAP